MGRQEEDFTGRQRSISLMRRHSKYFIGGQEEQIDVTGEGGRSNKAVAKGVYWRFICLTAIQQTVIVAVPFAALVDDIIKRGKEAGLGCQEWRDENCGGSCRQLVVVSADGAVRGFIAGAVIKRRWACVPQAQGII